MEMGLVWGMRKTRSWFIHLFSRVCSLQIKLPLLNSKDLIKFHGRKREILFGLPSQGLAPSQKREIY